MPSFSRQTWGTVALLRPGNALGTLLSFGVGYVLAGGGWSAKPLLGGLTVLALLHSAATLDNDVQDIEIDRLNGRHGQLIDGLLQLDAARWLAYGLAAAAVGLAHRLGPVHLIFILIFLGLVWLYNDPPLQLSRRPVSSIIVLGLAYGAVPLAYGYGAAGGEMNVGLLVLAAAWGAGRASLSILKDFKDEEGDRKSGKKTFYLRYGRGRTVGVSLAGGIIGYAAVLVALVAQGRFGSGISWLLGGLVLVPAVRDITFRWRLRKARTSDGLNRILHHGLVAHNQFEGALLLCLAWLGR